MYNFLFLSLFNFYSSMFHTLARRKDTTKKNTLLKKRKMTLMLCLKKEFRLVFFNKKIYKK